MTVQNANTDYPSKGSAMHCLIAPNIMRADWRIKRAAVNASHRRAWSVSRRFKFIYVLRNPQTPKRRRYISRGRRLAWIRIHAWGACDPGFKSQRPHHSLGSEPPGPPLLCYFMGCCFRGSLCPSCIVPQIGMSLILAASQVTGLFLRIVKFASLPASMLPTSVSSLSE